MSASEAGAAHAGAERGQFSLLLTRRFSPFFITQALGAFNDNVYRNAVIVLIVFGSGSLDRDFLANMGAGLFALPFFLFSALAGEIADHGDKAALTRRIKIAEICIMLLGGLAVASGSVMAVMAVLFLMGTQSTFFGPIKYAIIPQHLRQAELVGGNGLVQMGTFVAIPAGLMLGGALAGAEPAGNRPLLIGVTVVGLATAGYLASRFIPGAPPAEGAGRICWNPVTVIARMSRAAAAKRSVLLSILGISWFWLLGSVVLAQMPNYGKEILNASETVTTSLMATLAVGIGVGSVVCEWLSGRRVEIGLTPIGSLGLTVVAAHLAFSTMSPVTPEAGLAQFLAAGGWGPVLDLFLIGVFGGLYVVPMYSVIQQRTRQETRARVIAFNNIVSSLFMVIGAGLSILVLVALEMSIPDLFLVLAAINLGVAIFVFWEVPEFVARFLVWCLMRSLYRLRFRDLDRVPERGAAVLVCNHVSYVDALLILGVLRRPVRFVMIKRIYDMPLLNFIFRSVNAVPITARKDNPEIYRKAFESLADALRNQELVCIFPEGHLTSDGRMHEFRPGVLKLLEQVPVPVIPMALRGLWGSLFSHQGRGAFRGGLKWLRAPVELRVGKPMAPEGITTDQLYAEVARLRGAGKAGE
ncbi:MAG: hypothetical protein F4Z95_07800 [Gammaproteobacteria bacterium]|nr:hypothetical protein [Gammaproteobacteria bacterium]